MVYIPSLPFLPLHSLKLKKWQVKGIHVRNDYRIQVAERVTRTSEVEGTGLPVGAVKSEGK